MDNTMNRHGHVRGKEDEHDSGRCSEPVVPTEKEHVRNPGSLVDDPMPEGVAGHFDGPGSLHPAERNMAMTTPHQLALGPDSNGPERETIELHVRRVPRPIWLRARQQALAQKLSFRNYVIGILEIAGNKGNASTEATNGNA
jgi:hypothetical protein